MDLNYPLDDDVELPREPPATVRRRLDEWLETLATMRAGIEAWASANGWTVAEGMKLPLRTEHMERAGISEVLMSSLTIRAPDGKEILFQPRTPWAGLSSGLIYIYAPKGSYDLFDKREPFEPQNWILRHVGHPDYRRQFEPELLAGMV